MDEDKIALVEKIIKDIHNVMSKNGDLYSFDIVPVEVNFQNKSPVLHLENCLGLESWCVKHVFMLCYSEIMEKYFPQPNRKPLKLTSTISERLIKLLNITLLIRPELNSLWNKRREMVTKSLVEKSLELRFTRLVLSWKPKCNEVFSYRRWLIEAILKEDLLQSNYIENLVNEELVVCGLASDKTPNNYHSWSHRMWLLNILKQIKTQFDLNFLYVKEYNFSQQWSAKHVSDFSCFHYRQFCIKNLFTVDNKSWKTLAISIDVNLQKTFLRLLVSNIPQGLTIDASEEQLQSYTEDVLVNLLLYYAVTDCSCDVDNKLVCRKLELLFHELVLNNELLQFYKHHETLWYHRRFIIHEIMLVLYSRFGLERQNGALVKRSCMKCHANELREKQAKIGRYDSSVYSSVLFNVLMNHEKKFVNEMNVGGDNYADRHEKYLKFVEGLNYVM